MNVPAGCWTTCMHTWQLALHIATNVHLHLQRYQLSSLFGRQSVRVIPKQLQQQPKQSRLHHRRRLCCPQSSACLSFCTATPAQIASFLGDGAVNLQRKRTLQACSSDSSAYLQSVCLCVYTLKRAFIARIIRIRANFSGKETAHSTSLMVMRAFKKICCTTSHGSNKFAAPDYASLQLLLDKTVQL